MRCTARIICAGLFMAVTCPSLPEASAVLRLAEPAAKATRRTEPVPRAAPAPRPRSRAAPAPADAWPAAGDAFEAAGARRRLQDCLELIAAGRTLDVVGRKRWAGLVEQHRSRIEAAASHEQFADRMNDLLDDAISHFRYMTPEDFSYWLARSAFSRPPAAVEHVGLFSEQIDGRWYVRGVLEGSPADRAVLPIRVGDEILAVDGRPYRPFSPLRGRAGQPTRFAFRRSNDATYEVELRPVREPLARAVQQAIRRSIRVIEVDGRRLAYMHSWTLLGGREFDELLKLQNQVDGLLLDFRDGFGGRWERAGEFLLGRRGEAGDGQAQWRKPVVLLIDDGTRSAKEVVAAKVRQQTDIPLIGEPTPGHVTSVGGFRRVGDGLLLLPGQRFAQEGKPTLPDMAVARDIRLCEGDDPQMEAAVRELTRRIQARSAGETVPRQGVGQGRPDK